MEPVKGGGSSVEVRLAKCSCEASPCVADLFGPCGAEVGHKAG